MTEQTARLRLPYILPSQAQKHVTHNEALQRLDAIVQLVVKAVVAAPPENASEGECFLLLPGLGQQDYRQGPNGATDFNLRFARTSFAAALPMGGLGLHRSRYRRWTVLPL